MYFSDNQHSIEILGYSNVQPLYGSYLAVQELDTRIQNLDFMHKEIVKFYINQYSKSLPEKIYYLICVLCDYMGSGIITNELSEISCRYRRLQYMTSEQSIVYWNIPTIYISTPEYIHTWDIEITEKSWSSKIKIGLQCKSSQHPNNFYGVDNKGNIYNNNIIKGEHHDLRTVTLCYNLNEQTLSIFAWSRHVQVPRCQKMTQINEFRPGHYYLAFYLNDEERKCEVEILKYSNAKPLYGSYLAATELDTRMQNIEGFK